jgi:hypothetical protein
MQVTNHARSEKGQARHLSIQTRIDRRERLIKEKKNLLASDFLGCLQQGTHWGYPNPKWVFNRIPIASNRVPILGFVVGED